jgi:superfamily II DNA/RNA helicase
MDQIIDKLEKKYKQSLFVNAISIFTRFPKMKRLDSKINLQIGTIDFIKKYLGVKNINDIQLYPHQYNSLYAYCNKGKKNFILTSSTGSGKSLVFWCWVIEKLLTDKQSTAILCFPTQALMWGQADRLAQISESSSIKTFKSTGEIGWSGSLNLSKNRISWTVWKGTKNDKEMKSHEKSDAFKESRIRLATVDKAHFSLIQYHRDFTKNLSCIVLDEAHQYDSIFGANVHYFLKRVYLAKESAKKEMPNVFLASATLSESKSFASKLTSLRERDIYSSNDAAETSIEKISLKKAKSLIKKPSKYYNEKGLLRIALFIDSSEENHRLSDILYDTKTIGSSLNIIYFSESKHQSNIQARYSKTDQRTNIIYHGDIPPLQRRQIERQFNNNEIQGVNLIATNALELGVDIEGLDICLLDDLPPKRTAFLQRIGRVGRRSGKPGLILINLSSNPFDRQIADDLEVMFKFDNSKTIPIPENLELLRLKHMITAHYEGCYRNYANRDWEYYKALFEKHFGIFYDKDEATNRLKERYPNIFDISGTFWVHKGFRGSIGEGKIPLRKRGTTRDDVAWIEDVYIFRDAHPGAIYLNYEGRCWQIKSYSGNWGESIWEHPDSNIVLGKIFKNIQVVNVVERKDNIITRGMWNEKISQYQIINDFPDYIDVPGNIEIDYGIWEYYKKFDGYKEIDLSTGDTKTVTIKEITDQFKNAMDKGKEFPFLPSLSYRTYGWEWKFDDAFESWKNDELKSIEELIGYILEPYFADVVQANPSDLIIKLSLSDSYLRIVDATPGGNGLSETLLTKGNMEIAFSNCLNILSKYKRKPKKFSSFIIQLCRKEPNYGAKKAIEIIEEMQSYWEE